MRKETCKWEHYKHGAYHVQCGPTVNRRWIESVGGICRSGGIYYCPWCGGEIKIIIKFTRTNK